MRSMAETAPRPTVAVDLRALVPAATGIGVYTRSTLAAAAGRFRYLGLAHRPVHHRAELTALGVELDDRRSRLPLGVAWQQIELPRELARRHRRGEADLLWSPLNTLPATCPVPAVLTVQDLTALLFPETHTLKVRWSIYPFFARSLARARRIVTLSQATADDLAFHFPEHAGRIRVTGAGVDPVFTPAGTEEVAAIRAELGASAGYLLYVGTLEPRKNVATLISAWSALKADDEHFPPLVLAGDAGWHNRHLRRRIEALAPHGLTHLGRVDRQTLVRLYQGALGFVFPSLYEGFGLPPLEAMACGVPVVVTRTSSLPEVVGDAGVIVEPSSVRSLAEALGSLVKNPSRATELAERGRERSRRFTWEQAAAALEAVFAEALGEG